MVHFDQWELNKSDQNRHIFFKIDVLFSSNLFFVQMQGFISSGGLGKCRGKEVSHHVLNGYLYLS